MPKFVAVFNLKSATYYAGYLCGRPVSSYVLQALSEVAVCDRILIITDAPRLSRTIAELALPKVDLVQSPDMGSNGANIRHVLAVEGYNEAQRLLFIDIRMVLLTAKNIGDAFQDFLKGGTDNMTLAAYPPTRTSVKFDEAEVILPPRLSLRFCTYGRLLASPPYGRTREGSFFSIRGLKYNRRDRESRIAFEAILRERHHRVLKLKPTTPIRLFLTDVDGTLTDSGMYYSETGDELKKFNTRDGKGLQLLREAGIQVGIITGENRELVQRRADKLKLDHCFLGIADKVPVVQKLLRQLDLDWPQVAFIGDDLNDTALLKKVGFSAVPADAIARNREVADFVCRLKGGEGCVREFAEHLLKQR